MVGAVHDAVLAVPALTGEVELAVQPIEGDGRTLHEDAFHGFGAMLAEVADSLDVVVMVPGNQNVLFQIFGVVRIGTIDDAALRQRGIAAVQLFSGDNEGYLIPGVRQSKGGRAAADPGADDENLCFQALLLCHTAFF